MKKITAYILLFLSIFALNFAFLPPAFAGFSSLDSPAGAELAAYEAGDVASATPAGSLVQSTSGSLSAANAELYATGTTVINNGGSFAGGAAIAVVGASGLALMGLTASNLSSLRDLARQKYCNAHPTDSVCGNPQGTIVMADCLTGEIGYVWDIATRGIPQLDGGHDCYRGYPTISGVLTPEGHKVGINPYSFNSSPSTFTQDALNAYYPSAPAQWSDWPQDKRDAATALLSNSDYYNNSTTTSPTAIPDSFRYDQNLTSSKGGFYQDGNGLWNSLNPGGFCLNLANFCNCSPPSPTPSPSNTTPPPTPTPTNTTSPPTPSPTDTPTPDSCSILHPVSDSKLNADKEAGFLKSAADLLISILPSTPNSMRLPTILANMGGQGSLAGNLALELYSTAWQYFAIIAFVKFYKLIPGKMT
jgi:hypothetical protein